VFKQALTINFTEINLQVIGNDHVSEAILRLRGKNLISPKKTKNTKEFLPHPLQGPRVEQIHGNPERSH
jgi:hypothetical protein